jgi:hypothetical protein
MDASGSRPSGSAGGPDKLADMASDGPAGFWSYAHEDDEQDGGRIRALAKAVKAEFSLLTGEELILFVDHDDLQWGDEWRARINEALSSTTFFIPVITPRYFAREECRLELLTFAGQAKSLGRSDLLMSIYYVQVLGFGSDASSDDEAVDLVASMQWDDWRELRLEGQDSPAYRKQVNHLAWRLVKISRSLAERDEAVGAELAKAVTGEDEPGLVELMAAAEAAMPRFNATMDALMGELNQMGEIAEGWVPKIARATSKSAGASMHAFAQLATALSEPAERVNALGKQYANELVTIDPAILSLIRFAQAGGWDPSDAAELFANIRELRDVSERALAELRKLVAVLDQTAGLSRDLRRPVWQLRDGLKGVLDSSAIIEEWDRRASQADGDGPQA